MSISQFTEEFNERLDINEMLSDFWQKSKDSKTTEEYQTVMNEYARKISSYFHWLQDKVEVLERERSGEVWYWLGDGNDHPESLTCPILIEPQDLIKLRDV